jgi:hypothetical protein
LQRYPGSTPTQPRRVALQQCVERYNPENVNKHQAQTKVLRCQSHMTRQQYEFSCPLLAHAFTWAGSAPDASNILTIGRSSLWLATCSGVLSWNTVQASATQSQHNRNHNNGSNRVLTIRMNPQLGPQASLTLQSCASMEQPALIHTAAVSVEPDSTATCSNVWPYLSRSQKISSSLNSRNTGQ